MTSTELYQVEGLAVRLHLVPLHVLHQGVVGVAVETRDTTVGSVDGTQ